MKIWMIAPALVAAASTAWTPVARAQDGLEEVVVTAQKRTESLEDVPVAVSVLGADAIENAFSNNIESLQSLVPSVSFRKGNTTRNSALTVRGVGTISFSVAAEPSVATVVDGVVLGRSGQAFTDLYDLERIEVLRGPQGTLFGKNASAGVVNITTRRPTEEFEGTVNLTAFQDNEVIFKGRASGALSDRARASVTLLRSEFDGYIRNVFNNETVNGYDRLGIRGMLELDLADDLSALVIAEYYQSDDDCCADLEARPSGRNPDSEAAPDGDGLDLGQRLVDHDFATTTEDETTAFSLQLDKDLGEGTLTSITAWRSWENTEFREGDFTSIAGDSDGQVFDVPFQLHDIGPQEWSQFSQEIRYASPQGNKFEYQVGGFYWNLDSERSFTRFASCQNNSGQNDDILAANPGLTCNANDIVDGTAFMETNFTNFALFGEARYHFTDSFTAFFGLRYTDDEVSFRHNRRSNDPFGRTGVGVRPATLNTDFEGETDETDLSGRVGFQWRTERAGTIYGSYSQGYKGPAFNVFFNMADTDTLPIGSETSDAYEIGYKYASNKVLASVALFLTEIDGFQANNFDTSTGTTITRLTNAGSVSTQGVEFDLLWRPLDNWTISGGFAAIDASIDSFNCPPGEACTDRSGLALPFAPDLKYSLVSDYTFPVGDVDVIINASFVHTDEQFSTLPNNDGTFPVEALLPEYDLLNATLGFSFNDDRYRLSIIGKNLTDESFTTTFSGDGFRYQIPREADRYFGVSFRANFN